MPSPTGCGGTALLMNGSTRSFSGLEEHKERNRAHHSAQRQQYLNRKGWYRQATGVDHFDLDYFIGSSLLNACEPCNLDLGVWLWSRDVYLHRRSVDTGCGVAFLRWRASFPYAALAKRIHRHHLCPTNVLTLKYPTSACLGEGRVKEP